MLHLEEESKLRVRVNKNFLHILTLSRAVLLGPETRLPDAPSPLQRSKDWMPVQDWRLEMRVHRLPATDRFLLKVATTLTPDKSHTLDPSLGSTRRGLARKSDLAWGLPAPP